MSDFDPAELARLADAATPGEWVEDVSQGGGDQVFAGSVWGPFVAPMVDKRADAEFIAYCGTHRDAIVAAMQPRTVATVDELDALPDDTVIRDRLGFTYLRASHEGPQWLVPGSTFGADSIDFDETDLPIAVLWLPEDGAR